MKVFRIPAALLTLTTLSLLAACGGGGGGGGTTPPTGPGGGPPPPTSTPTSSPTTSPTSTPTASPTPGSTAISSNSTIDVANEGFVPAGASAFFNPSSGDYSDGGQGSAVSSNPTVNCITGGGMEPTGSYSHMHVYIGFIVNGKQVQVPGGIGMFQPGGATPGRSAGTVYESATQCLYTVHSHDESGVIHLEDPTKPQSTTAVFNLKNVFDVWGNGPGNANFPSGSVTIAVGTPSKTVNGDDFVTSYNTTTAAPGAISLTRHMAIWVIVGAVPTSLPQVQWGIAN